MGNSEKNNDLFAVIGVGMQFPKAKDKEEFWKNIKEGRNCITKIPVDRWDYSDYVGKEEAEAYSQYGSFIDDLDLFNPLLFNISPRDAELMDPQLRKLMEVTLSALDDAGYRKEEMRDTGVFIGNIHSEYVKRADNSVTAGLIGMTAQYDLANKLSNVFNFTGPSVVMNTACSSSLTAIHSAINSLKNGECKCALIGGCNLQLSPERFIGLKEVGIIGNRQYCAPFGEENGFILGEGIGVIILKKLEEAKQDHDSIYGLIRGSVCRHMGGNKAFGDIDSQVLKKITQETLDRSGVSPEMIQLVETGANGVSVLDVGEFNCINEIWKEAGVPSESVAVSSVKSNLGNIEAASGIAQVVKVLMQMKEHVFVPSIHVGELNHEIERGGPLKVQTTLTEWKESETPRMALISTVGAGGSVVQLICEEYQEKEVVERQADKGDRNYVCLLSAPEEVSLNQTVEEFVLYLSSHTCKIQDIAYTLQCGREQYRCRLSLTAKDQTELLEKLNSYLSGDHTSVFCNKLKASAKELALQEKEQNMLCENGQEETLAQKWAQGYKIDWEGLQTYYGGRRIHIPGLKMKRKKYWMEEKVDTKSGIQPAETLEGFIVQVFRELLKMEGNEMELDENLKSYGLDSISSMRAINKMNEVLHVDVQPSQMMDLQTMRDIVNFLKTDYHIGDQDIKELLKQEDKDSEETPMDVREAITDILLKKVINGDISAEKVSEIDELLFS